MNSLDNEDGAIMKALYKTLTLTTGFALAVLLAVSGTAQAQSGIQPQADPAAQPQQQQVNQTNQADQMLGFLNLTQDQVMKIRMINVELREERQEANLRLRLANRALQEAIQSPTPDETLISQRSKEVADAQANTIRLRSLTEARILQVLTPEQRYRLRERRRQQAMQNRQRDGNQLPRGLGRPQRGLQQNSNSNTPLTPRQQRRVDRQQQQQQNKQPTKP
jgi:Spy/CpxP family protein refolding chaperone